MTAITYTAISKPAPTFLKDHRACKRCGLVRKSERVEQGFCIDCRRFARADGWVTK